MVLVGATNGATWGWYEVLDVYRNSTPRYLLKACDHKGIYIIMLIDLFITAKNWKQ